jgi:hypothetical protein
MSLQTVFQAQLYSSAISIMISIEGNDLAGNYGRAFGLGFFSVTLSAAATYIAGTSCVFFAVLAYKEEARNIPEFLLKPAASAILSVSLAFLSACCFILGVFYFLLAYSSILKDIFLTCAAVCLCFLTPPALGLVVALYKATMS